MIAQAGLLSFRMGQVTPLAKSTCTQRFVFINSCNISHTRIVDFVLIKCMSHGELSDKSSLNWHDLLVSLSYQPLTEQNAIHLDL